MTADNDKGHKGLLNRRRVLKFKTSLTVLGRAQLAYPRHSATHDIPRSSAGFNFDFLLLAQCDTSLDSHPVLRHINYEYLVPDLETL
jgi:hypothetical protein